MFRIASLTVVVLVGGALRAQDAFRESRLDSMSRLIGQRWLKQLDEDRWIVSLGITQEQGAEIDDIRREIRDAVRSEFENSQRNGSGSSAEFNRKMVSLSIERITKVFDETQRQRFLMLRAQVMHPLDLLTDDQEIITLLNLTDEQQSELAAVDQKRRASSRTSTFRRDSESVRRRLEESSQRRRQASVVAAADAWAVLTDQQAALLRDLRGETENEQPDPNGPDAQVRRRGNNQPQRIPATEESEEVTAARFRTLAVPKCGQCYIELLTTIAEDAQITEQQRLQIDEIRQAVLNAAEQANLTRENFAVVSAKLHAESLPRLLDVLDDSQQTSYRMWRMRGTRPLEWLTIDSEVAGALALTDEQRSKLAALAKNSHEPANARRLRHFDDQALALLTEDQTAQLEKLQGDSPGRSTLRDSDPETTDARIRALEAEVQKLRQELKELRQQVETQ